MCSKESCYTRCSLRLPDLGNAESTQTSLRLKTHVRRKNRAYRQFESENLTQIFSRKMIKLACRENVRAVAGLSHRGALLLELHTGLPRHLPNRPRKQSREPSPAAINKELRKDSSTLSMEAVSDDKQTHGDR